MDNEAVETETETTEIEVETETETNTTTEEEIDINTMSDDDFLAWLEEEEKQTKEPVNEVEEKEETENVEEEVETEENDEEETNEPNNETTTDTTGFDRIFKEGFKADGKIVKPDTVEDAISLMQKGVNYNRKMQEINQYKKQIESLKSAGITSLSELNYALDLYKGDVEAIKKLLKEKEVDTYSLDLEEVNYKPNADTIVSDDTITFNDIIAQAKDGGYYEKLYTVLTKTWDERSKNKILSDNNLFKHFAEEMSLDRFDKVQEEVEKRRLFGRIDSSLSDLDAYIQVVTELVNNQQQQQTKSDTVIKKDIDINKKAVKPTKSVSASSKPKIDDDELNKLSDEEYLKLFNAGKI